MAIPLDREVVVIAIEEAVVVTKVEADSITIMVEIETVEAKTMEATSQQMQMVLDPL